MIYKRKNKTLVCEHCKETFEEYFKKKFCSPECHSEAMRISSTGRTWTEEKKKEHRLFRKGKTWEEIFGIKKANTLKQQKSELWKGNKYNKFQKGHLPWNTGKKLPEKMKEKIRKSTKKAYESEELRERHRQNTINYLKNGGMKNHNTSIELKVKEVLKQLNIEFEQQKVFKLGIADFYLSSLKAYIFCDGSYWHNYPYGKPRDSLQVEYLESRGFNVYRLWEQDINNNCKKLVEEMV